MFKRRFRLPSPALVISMIALALVLGGTAVAASTATHGDKKADVKLIKKMAPSLSVKHAKTADNATNATNATTAATATNATSLGGQPASYYAHAGHEAVHLIGAAGEPAFQNGWTNFNSATWSNAGYWKDPTGVVHLTGTLNGANANTIVFTLPAGYRPALNQFMAAANGQTAMSFEVMTTGDVKASLSGTLGIDGLTFIAGTQAATAPRHAASGPNPNGR
jgi:hypothetical protein